MDYLYGTVPGSEPKLAATFDSEAQLLAYVTWARLKHNPNGIDKFEQGSVLAGYSGWKHSATPLTDEDSDSVFHDPTPNMM